MENEREASVSGKSPWTRWYMWALYASVCFLVVVLAIVAVSPDAEDAEIAKGDPVAAETEAVAVPALNVTPTLTWKDVLVGRLERPADGGKLPLEEVKEWVNPSGAVVWEEPQVYSSGVTHVDGYSDFHRIAISLEVEEGRVPAFTALFGLDIADVLIGANTVIFGLLAEAVCLEWEGVDDWLHSGLQKIQDGELKVRYVAESVDASLLSAEGFEKVVFTANCR